MTHRTSTLENGKFKCPMDSVHSFKWLTWPFKSMHMAMKWLSLVIPCIALRKCSTMQKTQILRLTHQAASLKSTRKCTPITFSLSSEPHYNSPFTISKLTSALHSCHNTHEGPDHIHYLLLKHLPPSSLTFLLALFNRLWTKGDFPPSWREAFIFPFVKPGKSGSLPNDYRPIALTSCLCKLLERMVNFRLMWHLESNNPLSPCQFGFCVLAVLLTL